MGNVELNVVSAKTEGVEVLQGVPDFGAFEHSFGGDAAPVQADAAQVLLLDQGRAQAQLGGANGRHVTAGATADDEYIVFIGHGGS